MPSFQFPNIRHLPKYRHPPVPLASCFQCVTYGLWIAFPYVSGRNGGEAEYLTTIDDLENREISAAEIHGIYPKWAYGGGAGRGAEQAF
jgi:hypothetical protein